MNLLIDVGGIRNIMESFINLGEFPFDYLSGKDLQTFVGDLGINRLLFDSMLVIDFDIEYLLQFLSGLAD